MPEEPKKIFFETAPSPSYQGLDDRLPPPPPPISEGVDPPLRQFRCFSTKFNFFVKLNADGILV